MIFSYELIVFSFSAWTMFTSFPDSAEQAETASMDGKGLFTLRISQRDNTESPHGAFVETKPTAGTSF
jgi:hypothetical protein